MNIEIPCQTCGKLIIVLPSQVGRKKFCSRECSIESKKRPIRLTCRQCGKEFTKSASQADTVYCSPECYAAGRAHVSSDGMRTCTQCGQNYPATTEYFGRSATRFGLSGECKRCLGERGKEYRAINRERIRQGTNEYRAKNTERVRQWKRDSYLRNRENVILTTRKYRLAHPERQRRTAEEQRLKDAKRKRQLRTAEGSFSKQDVAQKYTDQDGRCFYCSCELATYHTDHYIPISKGGTNWPDNIVLACPQCNLAKGEMLPDDFIENYLPISLRLRTSNQTNERTSET